ncbi:HNH endonuclease [Bradyrhizobium guangdongense]
MFEVGAEYTRADVQELLRVPESRRGGDWDTGYTSYNNELYIFCNIGAAGRTGHDYPNRWEGDDLVWSAKNRSRINQPLMQAIASGLPARIFHRSVDRAPFVYAGMARAVDVRDSSPVKVRWSFADPPAKDAEKLTAADIKDELLRLGFLVETERHKKTWSATRESITLYIKMDSGSHVLVVDPSFEDRVTALSNIPGVSRPNSLFYHNSNMLSFPKRTWTGQRPIPFGVDFGFKSGQALRKFIDILDGSPAVQNRPGDSMDIDPRTETEAMRAVRLGQQNFRRDLLRIWNGRCALTGLDFPELLRASHIKAWCDCDPKERLDADNGLLLAVHIDGLFDRGFVSFDHNGRILLSQRFRDDHLGSLGISADLTLSKLTAGHRKYLQHHRAKHGFEPSAT